MTDSRTLFDDLQKRLDLWRNQIGKLEELYNSAKNQSTLPATYLSTLDELRLTIDHVADLLATARKSEGMDREKRLTDLEAEFDRADELIKVKLSTMQHQSF